MEDDHSGAIWVLGILLVIAAAVTSPYWQNVYGAVSTGTVKLGNQPGAAAYNAATLGPGAAIIGDRVSVTADNWNTLGALRATVTPGSGLWLTLGALVLVVILAGVAKISPAAGAFALVLLIGLIVLFLLGHTAGVQGFFGLFTPRAA